MNLSYSTSKYKDREYKSHSIAESYHDGKTSRKRTIWAIGKLTDQQADFPCIRRRTLMLFQKAAPKFFLD